MKHNIHIREITKEEKKTVEQVFDANREALNAYADLLLWWNDKINLVSREVSRETVMLHINHSLYMMLSRSFERAAHLLDTGTGGGLPGLPLAICTGTKKYLLNDIISKKIFAVNDMVQKLSLSKHVTTRAGSIENVKAGKEWVIITKHAFKVGDLLGLTEESGSTEYVFLKGADEAIREVEEVKSVLDVEVIKLDPSFMNEFYAGKGVVTIRRGSS